MSVTWIDIKSAVEPINPFDVRNLLFRGKYLSDIWVLTFQWQILSVVKHDIIATVQFLNMEYLTWRFRTVNNGNKVYFVCPIWKQTTTYRCVVLTTVYLCCPCVIETSVFRIKLIILCPPPATTHTVKAVWDPWPQLIIISKH